MANRRRDYTFHFYLMSMLVVVALGAVNYLAMEHHVRIDLTGDSRYTLSEGTRTLLAKLTDTITVTYYVSEEPPPVRVNLERDVVDKLEELAGISDGRMTFTVERISNQEVVAKADELKELGISRSNEMTRAGDDETLVGIQGFFSSMLVRYGLAEPIAINGIFNLVSRDDESRQHRVDTLEFDIMFAVLKMRAKTVRPATLEQMLKSLKRPLTIAYIRSVQMPAHNPTLGARIEEALGRMVEFNRELVTWDPEQDRKNIVPFNKIVPGLPPNRTDAPTVDPSTVDGEVKEARTFYYTYVELSYGRAVTAYAKFNQEDSAEKILDILEERLWLLVKPRTRLGVIYSGASTRPAYSPVVGYMQREYDYDLVEINLRNDGIPDDLALLLVFEPNRLNERALYEIDRHLVSGGNVAMLYQGWESPLNAFRIGAFDFGLTKVETQPHFESWCADLGIEFKQDLLIQRGGYRIHAAGPRDADGRPELVPIGLPLGARVSAFDTASSSVYSRNLADTILPFPVEMKLDDEKIAELGLTKTEVIRLQGEIYRFLPVTPAFPRIPRMFDMNSPAEIEEDPEAEASDGDRLQRKAGAPLISAVLSGNFKSHWRGKDVKVPKWEGGESEDTVPDLRSRRGNLVITSCAATLHIEYWSRMTRADQTRLFSPSLDFYRNVADAFVYGDELVSLRARTGVAPRIAGPIKNSSKYLWFLICLGGVPACLVAAGLLQSARRTRRQRDYEETLKA